MAIKFAKLMNDEDIVADIENAEDVSKLTFKNPARLVITHQGVGMMPMNPFMKAKSVEIPKSYIVYTTDVDEEISNAYNAKFGSGIVLAPAGTQIPGTSLFMG
jgi:hypothetical protein